jgi:Cu(I)/Ag(I) efflux system membrane protein CusA/SilA
MQRIAVPMIGGMVSSTLLTLIVIPSIYAAVKGFRIAR